MNQDQFQNNELFYDVPPKKNAKYYRKRAWSLLTSPFSNWGKGALMGLVFQLPTLVSTYLAIAILLVGAVAGIVGSMVHPALGGVILVCSAVLPLLIAYLPLFLLTMPMSFGLYKFYLNLIDGKAYDDGNKMGLKTLLAFFKNPRVYLKSIGLYTLYLLIILVGLIPCIVAAIVAGVVFPTPETGWSINFIWQYLLTYGGMAVSYAILLPLAYTFMPSLIIFADYPDIGIIDALRSSAAMMRGNKWKRFCLEFSFIGWTLLASLFPFGSVAIAPYQSTAIMLFYHDISNRGAGADTEFPSVNPDDYSETQE